MKKNSINIKWILILVFTILSTIVSIANSYLPISEEPFPKEEVVLICDRNSYLAGENILFTASVLRDIQSDIETGEELYLEIFKEDISFAQEKYKLINGRVQGSFNVPENLLSGSYFLRAYTNLMQNQKTETFFHKKLIIINPYGKIDNNYGKYSQHIITQNNELIGNIQNDGAVFLKADLLKNVKKSLIVDNNNDSIYNIRFYENGLGSFSFIPKLDNKYALKIYLKDNDSIVIKLGDTKPKNISSELANTINYLSISDDPLPQEKVVLICDRNFFLTGEDIIFSASVFINNQQDTALSKVLYLELFKDDLSYAKAKYKLIDGKTAGSISIPEGLLSGNYYLRAYTMYMRNQAPETFFNTHLTIINPERKVDNYYGKYSQPIIISTQNKNLIANIKNDGAILFNEHFLKNVKESLIVNNNNDSICNIKLYENGLGSFSFIPKLEDKYSLKVYLNNNDSIFIELEDVKPKGILTTFDYQISEAEIIQNGYILNSELKVYFVGNNNEIYDSKDIIIIDTITNIKFQNLSLPESVNYMIVADNQNNILSVSPFYASNETTKTGISINSENSFSKRDKVEFDIKGLNSDDDVVINVRKKTPAKPNDFPAELMYNPLILNTDYNIDHDIYSKFKKQLYLSFMINQEAFSYDSFKEIISTVNKNKSNTLLKDKVAETRDLSISGKLINKANQEPLINQTIYASVLGETPQLHTYDTDGAGNFIFSLNQLQGIHDVGLTLDSIDNVDAEIIVNNDFSTKFPKFIDYPVQADSTYFDFILSMFRNKQVNYKFKKIIQSEDIAIDTIPFPFQNPQSSILLSDYIELATMQEVLNEIVTYVSARLYKGKMVLNVLNDRTETQYNKPLVLIDNLVIFDIDELMKLNPTAVKKIEVITKPYTLGSKDFKGIIMITTKSGDFGGMQLPNETVFLKYITASPSSYYLYPNFGDENIPLQQPYFANTIYNKSIEINSSNDNHFSFYTSDETGKFEISVSIINQDGSTSVINKIIEVK